MVWSFLFLICIKINFITYNIPNKTNKKETNYYVTKGFKKGI